MCRQTHFEQKFIMGKCVWSVEQRSGGVHSVGNGRRHIGREWYKGGSTPQQLSCEEANGLSSPSHAHSVFSDGHSSGETHIALATGTEISSQLVSILHC